MVKIRRRQSITILGTVLVIGILCLIPVAAASDWKIIDIPLFDSPDKGNPKLDSPLNQLVQAEREGEAASFAEQSGIGLVNGGVRVIIECVPAQVDAAMVATSNAGAKLEASHDNLLQVVVPITSLTTLADVASIHFIRLPQYPLSAATNGGEGLINATE